MLNFIEKYIAQSNKVMNPSILCKRIKQQELSMKLFRVCEVFNHYLWNLTCLSTHKMTTIPGIYIQYFIHYYVRIHNSLVCVMICIVGSLHSRHLLSHSLIQNQKPIQIRNMYCFPSVYLLGILYRIFKTYIFLYYSG